MEYSIIPVSSSADRLEREMNEMAADGYRFVGVTQTYQGNNNVPLNAVIMEKKGPR